MNIHGKSCIEFDSNNEHGTIQIIKEHIQNCNIQEKDKGNNTQTFEEESNEMRKKIKKMLIQLLDILS